MLFINRVDRARRDEFADHYYADIFGTLESEYDLDSDQASHIAHRCAEILRKELTNAWASERDGDPEDHKHEDGYVDPAYVADCYQEEGQRVHEEERPATLAEMVKHMTTWTSFFAFRAVRKNGMTE